MIADFFASEVMRDALPPALMIAVVASTVSVMVLAHRLSFLTVGVAHASLAGLGLAAVTGLPLLPMASLVAVGVALLLPLMPTQRGIHQDAASGMLFAGSMSLGVLLLSGADRQQVDIFGLLFGNILLISQNDISWLLTLSTAIMLAVAWACRIWWSIAFDAATARANGLPVQQYLLLLYAVVGLTVILCVKLAGVVLTTGLMVLPAAIAWFWGRSLWALWWISTVAAVTGVLSGLMLSYAADWPAGASIIAMLCLLFCASWGVQTVVRPQR